MRSPLTPFGLVLVLLAASCSGSSGGSGDPTGDADGPGQDTAAADAADAAVDLPADLPPGGDSGDAEVTLPYPPPALPVEFTRPADGEPIPADEVTAFTEEVTGLWKETGWFRWLLRTSTGVDASSGQESFLAWYNDIDAVKADGVVTLRQQGGEHNMWIPGSKVLSQVLNGCMLTEDPWICKAAEQYCRGLTASVKGFIWDEADPAPYLMARAIFPQDSTQVMDAETWGDDGRTKVMSFDGAKKDEVGWNAQTFAWPHNPTWGDIWITNMRSKDDVCAITRSTLFLHLAADGLPPGETRDACMETLDTMRGFNKDIVDSGYYIRTKDPEGQAYVIPDQDLGSYVWYLTFGEDNECTARLASDFIAYQEPRTGDCGSGYGTVYELWAVDVHYYNYPIVWNYHMAALGHALYFGYNDVALALLEGLAARQDGNLAPNSTEPGAEHPSWSKDNAVLLVQQAALGLPLTAKEARLVQQHWRQAVQEYSTWPNWDLWDPALPDGTYAGGDLRPQETAQGIPVEALALFVEYCNSPFKNPAGEPFVDCAVVADPSRWGGNP
ncbi:MAG: hypothetical protein FJ098_11250 [Deltaproteobacteria bacterium]|nr:hypothetical protein [Deltaproteobacteria bacterium]